MTAAAPASEEKPEALEDVDAEIARALACPCVADLRDGPCGPPFVQAFTCFFKSKHEDKGIVCYEQYQAMQACMMKHPEAFAKEFIAGKEESEEEQDLSSANGQQGNGNEQGNGKDGNQSSGESAGNGKGRSVISGKIDPGR